MNLMRKRRWDIFFGLALASLAVAGLCRCSSLVQSAIAKPKVELNKVSLRDANSSGATVVFGVGVENPNPFALVVDAVRYDVEIGGKPMSSGKLENGARVEANSKSIIEIPVPMRYQDVFSSMFEFLKNGSTTYRLSGDAAVGPLSIPFDNKGDLKLK